MNSAARPSASGREVAGVEDRDDDDGAQVVDDGERRQEHLERQRHAAAERRQHAQREGDVGGGGDRPALERRGIAPVDRHVDQRRHGHAAHRADHRQGDLRRLRQRALDDLALDLEPDQQEEERHQAVVDPEQDRLVEDERSQREAEADPQQAVDGVGERRVGEHEGSDRGNQQRHRRGRLAVDEFPQPIALSQSWSPRTAKRPGLSARAPC